MVTDTFFMRNPNDHQRIDSLDAALQVLSMSPLTTGG